MAYTGMQKVLQYIECIAYSIRTVRTASTDIDDQTIYLMLIRFEVFCSTQQLLQVKQQLSGNLKIALIKAAVHGGNIAVGAAC